MLAIGEDLRLERQEGSAGVDEVDARQAVFERHLLRAEVLLDRDREVGPALHRRVVGDDQDFAAGHAADARHEAGRRRLVVVHAVGSERGQLEERRARVDEAFDALANRQLALLDDGARGTWARRQAAPSSSARAARPRAAASDRGWP